MPPTLQVPYLAFAVVDAKDEARMKDITAPCGAPGPSLVGGDGAPDAWLPVHPGRRELEETCLPLLGRAVGRAEASP